MLDATQSSLLFHGATTAHDLPLIADNFAGGGGASTGIEQALGRSPDVAINHDAVALSMHAANHPETKHLINNIWSVDPRELVRPGQRVGLAWFSPDCKHHSKAKGGKPVEQNIRDLAWVVVEWARMVRPEIIMLENVEEFRDWGPLTADNKPDRLVAGQTFQKWVKALRGMGYKVQWRILRACDFGAPTIRKRLFVIARCDGKAINWPNSTHGDPKAKGFAKSNLKPWRTAAEIIDWSIACPSIFDTSAQIMEKHGLRAVRPLADNTLRRIARGIQRFVIEAKDPFFVTYGQHGGANRSAVDPLHTITASKKDQNCVVVPLLINVANSKTTGRGPNAWNIKEPVRTLTSSPGFALVAPTLISYYGEGEGGLNRTQRPDQPLTTVTTANRHAVVAAFLAQHNGGPRMENNAGRSAKAPLSTLTTRGTQQNIVAAHLMNMHGSARSARDARWPVTSICSSGNHATLIAAFMTKYYGQGEGQPCDEALHTLTTRDRFGLVTVEIQGQTYAITDIGMRMLTPREQFRAQGFPDSYRIDTGADGKPLPKTAQTRMCGNSVCPDLASALVAANCGHLKIERNA